MTEPLERLRAEHPGWTIRRDAGPDRVSYVAQRAQVVTAPTLDGLAGRLAAADAGAGADPQVAAARGLLAERHEPLTMTPGDLRALLARYRRRLTEFAGRGRALAPHAIERPREPG